MNENPPSTEEIVDIMKKFMDDVMICYPNGGELGSDELAIVRRFRIMKENTDLSDREILEKLR